jgi:hypothetical protein
MKNILLTILLLITLSCGVIPLRTLDSKGERVQIYGMAETDYSHNIWEYLAVRIDKKIPWAITFEDTCFKANIRDTVFVIPITTKRANITHHIKSD